MEQVYLICSSTWSAEKHTFDTIGQEKRVISERKQAALQSWLETAMESSWQKVVDCLEEVDMEVLAAYLRKVYNIIGIYLLNY